jgi:hypothetical protein
MAGFLEAATPPRSRMEAAVTLAVRGNGTTVSDMSVGFHRAREAQVGTSPFRD